MTKKKFIRKLRSYRLSRNQIKPLVDYVVESKGKVSYNEIIEEIQLSIMKILIKDICKEITIDFNAPIPVEYVSDEDLKMALTGIETIKEFLSNERLRNL